MIYAIIGARGGSSWKDKNLQTIHGVSLLEYAINTALKSEFITSVFVSSDSEDYGKIAKRHGAVFIKRPKKYAQDNSGDYGWINHLCDEIYEVKKYMFGLEDLLVFLRPTSPIRDVGVINNAIAKMSYGNTHRYYDSLMSVEEISDPLEKLIYIEKGNIISISNIKKISSPRQKFKTLYRPNGYVDILKVSNIFQKNSVYGKKILAYKTPKIIEIDTEDDLRLARGGYE